MESRRREGSRIGLNSMSRSAHTKLRGHDAPLTDRAAAYKAVSARGEYTNGLLRASCRTRCCSTGGRGRRRGRRGRLVVVRAATEHAAQHRRDNHADEHRYAKFNPWADTASLRCGCSRRGDVARRFVVIWVSRAVRSSRGTGRSQVTRACRRLGVLVRHGGRAGIGYDKRRTGSEDGKGGRGAGGAGKLEGAGWGSRGIEKRLDTKQAATQRANPPRRRRPPPSRHVYSRHGQRLSHTPPSIPHWPPFPWSRPTCSFDQRFDGTRRLAAYAAQASAAARCKVGLRAQQQ